MSTAIAISSKDTLGNNQVKLIGNCNPEADNAHLATFGKKVNALTTNALNSVTRVDKTDITDAQEGDTPTPTPTVTGLLDPELTISEGSISWKGNGKCYMASDAGEFEAGYTPSEVGPGPAPNGYIYLLESDGVYAKDWVVYP